jgi:hypothetical protein
MRRAFREHSWLIGRSLGSQQRYGRHVSDHQRNPRVLSGNPNTQALY